MQCTVVFNSSLKWVVNDDLTKGTVSRERLKPRSVGFRAVFQLDAFVWDMFYCERKCWTIMLCVLLVLP